MKKTVSITLEENDPCVAVKLCRASWGQIIDGLEVRAWQYERTAHYYHTGSGDECIEEVNDASEARNLAAWYR